VRRRRGPVPRAGHRRGWIVEFVLKTPGPGRVFLLEQSGRGAPPERPGRIGGDRHFALVHSTATLTRMPTKVDTSAVTLEPIPQTQDRRFDWFEVFGNHHPVELELGVGKGRFLIQQAEARPQVNFVGVEWASRYFRLVAERAAKRELANFRILRDDAGKFVRDNVPDHSVSVLHVYFPDPWPKAKQQKRRLVQPPFAMEAARILSDGGLVKLATDHEDYAKQMEQVFQQNPAFEQTFRAIGDEAPEGVTNWEQKFRAEGRTMHKYEFKCRPKGQASRDGAWGKCQRPDNPWPAKSGPPG
jgi:tRNA (guanine-N7-)-methyltransferase